MHVFLLAKALAKPFMNIAMPEPLQKPDALSSSISIGMLDRIYWDAFTGVVRLRRLTCATLGLLRPALPSQSVFVRVELCCYCHSCGGSRDQSSGPSRSSNATVFVCYAEPAAQAKRLVGQIRFSDPVRGGTISLSPDTQSV